MIFSKTKSDLPEYASHYGMHRPPFSREIEDDMYYAEPTRNQRLDILLHLTRYSNELLIVTGEEGIGKSTFLQQFLHRAEESWRICSLNAHDCETDEQVLKKLYLGFELEHESTQKNALQANLRKNLEQLLSHSDPVVLVVDDGHLLSIEALSLILDVATYKNISSNNAMRVILFCEPQIKILLAEPELGEKLRVRLRKIDLPAMDEYNTGYYLRHRLSQSGMEAEQFLTAATIHKIYTQSNGVPSLINDAADKILYDTTPLIRRTSYSNEKIRAGIKQVIAIGSAVALILALLMYFHFAEEEQPDSPSPEAENSLSIPEPPRTFPSLSQKTQKQMEAEKIKSAMEAQEAASLATSVKVETLEEIPFVAPIARPGANLHSEPDRDPTPVIIEQVTVTPVTISPVTVDPGTIQPIGSGIKEPDGKSSAQTTLQQTTTKQKTPEQITPEKTSPEQTTPEKNITPSVNDTKTLEKFKKENLSENELKDAGWLLSQDPKHFTLQLVAGHHKTTITRFIKKYQLDSEQSLAYFYSERNGKPWHNLTYGVFPNHKSATRAMADLPLTLTDVKPWIRRLKSVQTDISGTKDVSNTQ